MNRSAKMNQRWRIFLEPLNSIQISPQPLLLAARFSFGCSSLPRLNPIWKQHSLTAAARATFTFSWLALALPSTIQPKPVFGCRNLWPMILRMMLQSPSKWNWLLNRKIYRRIFIEDN